MNLIFTNGRAIIKDGKKILAKVIDRKEAYKGTRLENSFTQYPYSVEAKMGIRECRTLQECIETIDIIRTY